MNGASDQITAEVTGWPGVTAGPGTRGEFSFKFGRKEIGHPARRPRGALRLPQARVGGALRGGPRDVPPGVPGQAGLRARRIEDEDDVRDVIALMRLNYDRVATT